MGIYVVKTTAGREETVANMITERGYDEIHASLTPDKMRGYMFVESDSKGVVERAIDDIPNAQKMIEDETSMSEIEHFLEPASDVQDLKEDAVVRVTGGPFQGEKARVTEIDSSNERATVELYDATVPIPVEVRGDQLRVLDKQDDDEN